MPTVPSDRPVSLLALKGYAGGSPDVVPLTLSGAPSQKLPHSSLTERMPEALTDELKAIVAASPGITLKRLKKTHPGFKSRFGEFYGKSKTTALCDVLSRHPDVVTMKLATALGFTTLHLPVEAKSGEKPVGTLPIETLPHRVVVDSEAGK